MEFSAPNQKLRWALVWFLGGRREKLCDRVWPVRTFWHPVNGGDQFLVAREAHFRRYPASSATKGGQASAPADRGVFFARSNTWCPPGEAG
jgi:hypothetical protein